jgi:release factor glutamine methyltransferase
VPSPDQTEFDRVTGSDRSTFGHELQPVRQLLAEGRRRIAEAGSSEPLLEARVLLAHVLGAEASDLLMDLDREVTAAAAGDFETLVGRREAHEPLAYIVGEREFYGLRFIVDGRALIPRPETELLVDEALAFAGDRRHAAADELAIADIGTGSGCIVVSTATQLRDRRVRFFATDISEAAVELARLNAERHGVADRLVFMTGDALGPLTEPVDLIVANPPYIPGENVARLQPEITLFEPEVAVQGGPGDGLLVSRRIIEGAPELLRPGGGLLMEMGYGQSDAAIDIARGAFGSDTEIDVQLDLAGIPRVLRVRIR